MEFTTTYLVSQIVTIIMYILLAITYQVKNRKTVLILNFLALIANGIAYILLDAYTGLAMCIIALLRNTIFLIDEKKNGKTEKNNKKDIAILVILYTLSIISAIFTYDGFLSLLSVFATMLYTYSVWQKKTKIYKLLGIPIGILWTLYNFSIGSIFGVILEMALLVSSMIGYILEVRRAKIESK